MRQTKFDNIGLVKTQIARAKTTSNSASAKQARLTVVAMKRLLKESQILEQEKIPFVNVAIQPSNNNIFLWKGLLQGPVGSIYEGVYARIQIKLDEKTYPATPPVISIVGATIPHPLIFSNVLCLEVMQRKRWDIVYTVSSVA